MTVLILAPYTDIHNGTIKWTSQLHRVAAADVVYTDVWFSMGHTKPDNGLEKYRPYQVNKALMEHLSARYFMHCQPVHRGQEVTSDVCDSKESLMYLQSANRVHAQKAILHWLLAGESDV